MPALSWNEIRQRAVQFARDWKGEKKENAEAQTFWNEFFQVFGVKRRTVASFEAPVRSLKGNFDRIDLFWKGKLLAEHKSAGESLDKAESQAFQYIQQLASAGQLDEIPRYVALSNFHHVALYDLEPDSDLNLPLWRGQRYKQIEFQLEDLHRHVKNFAFFLGQRTHRFGEEDPANRKAAELMAGLHDSVRDSNYTGAHLERLLVRLLFCLFAEDTGIFEASQFEIYLDNKTREDGSDLGSQLNALFDVLNTPPDARNKFLDEDLAAFPYVNGALFADRLPTAGFDRDLRNRLRAACRFDWSRISPAIFGSLFQGIMEPKGRRQIGAHYTSEQNILKVIHSLFLDELQEEFRRVTKDSRRGHRTKRLREFQNKLASLKLLDPACGCGNFLVIAYRELRRLELQVLDSLYNFKTRAKELPLGEVAKLSQVDVDQFYGIEIGEWPARIAETALWLTDHQMNIELSLAAGNLFQRIPLRSTPHIHCTNALRVDWREILPANDCSYVLGNPPFVGKKERDDGQKADHDFIWKKQKGTGNLDYVTCWYAKVGEYVRRTRITCAFVSTNSISQGEQPGTLWSHLHSNLRLRIHFAHTTFAWRSDAKGAAHVHVVIIGFGPFEAAKKTLFIYDMPKGSPVATPAQNINPYLVDGPTVLIRTRTRPLCDVPAISYGSMMIDKDRKSGMEAGFIITENEREALIRESEGLEPYIRQAYGGQEYINGTSRWCLWLVGAPASLIRSSPRLRDRIAGIKRFREGSDREATKKLADTPSLFGEIRQPKTDYLLVPKVSSEAREYMPIGFLPPTIIATGSALVLPDASGFEFGVIVSRMHMAWLRCVGGRLESRYQYSGNIIYNNYPWPIEATAKQREAVEHRARIVTEKRQIHTDAGATLADLYDPLCTPDDLVAAHRSLDRAVDRCYRARKFESDRERVQNLFQLYNKLTSPLAHQDKKKKRRPRQPQ